MHFAKTTEGQKWLQIALDWHAVGLRRLFSKSWSVEIVGHFLESMGWLSASVSPFHYYCLGYDIFTCLNSP